MMKKSVQNITEIIDSKICTNNINNIKIHGRCTNIHHSQIYVEIFICKGCKNYVCFECITFDRKICINCAPERVLPSPHLSNRVCKKCGKYLEFCYPGKFFGVGKCLCDGDNNRTYFCCDNCA